LRLKRFAALSAYPLLMFDRKTKELLTIEFLGFNTPRKSPVVLAYSYSLSGKILTKRIAMNTSTKASFMFLVFIVIDNSEMDC
jgi:hypothetical protein